MFVFISQKLNNIDSIHKLIKRLLIGYTDQGNIPCLTYLSTIFPHILTRIKYDFEVRNDNRESIKHFYNLQKEYNIEQWINRERIRERENNI